MAKRRANGEGSIRKRKDGRWEGRYTAGYDPETGKRIIKNVLGRTQAEVKEKLRLAVEDNKKIDAAKGQDLTVGQWATLWFENYAKPAIRESTAEHYRNYIEKHIVPRIGKIMLRKLTTLDIQKFYNKSRESGRVQRYEGMEDLHLSNKTIRGLHAVLRQCLEQAVTERLIPYNPAANCKLPPKEKKDMQIIPPEKLGDYLRAAEEHGVLPMFYLELTTGLRRGELLALLWSDLNIKERCLTVSKSVARGKGELRVTEPKTKNSIRTVYIDDEAIRLLVEDRKNHPFSPYLFPSPVTGGMYGPDCVGRTHKKLLKKAGIEENVRFHDLRRTFATMALQNGVDPKTVSRMLGHYSAEFTLDVYTNVTKEMEKEAAEKIGSFMERVI
ncbi:site-specific integrase [uncultured Dysosmobacter sp.]|uniref:tyrosine-type recombinase/integrase n=1 Tax=uncultured Dysosmobacter sp. TaxID=2591384 RepID=UPI002615FAE5|nr:site-specific integrase [uncultured Dysosmobacter sp.]